MASDPPVSVRPSVLKCVIVNTRAVLLSSKNGVLLRNFSRDYKKLLGSTFPWRQHGFSSCLAMLHAMPEAVRLHFPSSDAECRLYGIGTSEMFMPSWVVKSQGLEQVENNRAGQRNSYTARRSLGCEFLGTRDDDTPSYDEEKLAFNSNGLVSVFIGWKGVLVGEEMKACLGELLANVIRPVELVYLEGSVAFARYHHISEAEHVISRCHGAVVCGVRLTVKPPRGKTHMADVSLSRRRGRGGRVMMTDSRRGLLPETPPPDDGRGVWTKRGRVLFSHLYRSSARLDTRQVDEFPTLSSPGGCVDVVSSPIQPSSGGAEMQRIKWNNHISPKSCVMSCGLAIGSCDQSTKSCDLISKSHDRKLGEMMNSPRVVEYVEWDSLPAKSCDTPSVVEYVEWDSLPAKSCDTPSVVEYVEWDSLPAKSCDESQDAVGWTLGQSRNEPSSGRRAVPYSRSEAERLMALISDPDSDDDSLQDFDWDDSLLDDVKTMSTPSAPASSLPPFASSLPPPLSPPLCSRSSPPPLLLVTPLQAPLSQDNSSFHNSSGSILSESDLISSESWSESSTTSVNEWVSPKYNVASDLVPATVSKMESPDMIWLQMTSDPKRDLDHISAMIVRAKPPKLMQVTLGSLCCFKLNLPKRSKTLIVRRAMVHETAEKHVNDPQVGVIMIDVGTSQECAIKDLYALPDCVQLEIHPPLACPWALKGVVSCYHDREVWFSQDLDKMKSHLSQRTIYVDSKTPTTFSKCGCSLVDMYFDPQGVRNVADLILKKCYFVTKPESETDVKTDSQDGKSCSRNGTRTGLANQSEPETKTKIGTGTRHSEPEMDAKTGSHNGKSCCQNGTGTGNANQSGPETDTKVGSHDSKSCSWNGTGTRHAYHSEPEIDAKTGSHNEKSCSRNRTGTDQSDDIRSLRPSGKRRSLMAMVTHAVSHLESLQVRPGGK